MKYIIILMFVGVVGHAQDPQTNNPKDFYPILDEYIKDGYNRNYRTHTRIFKHIIFVHFTDITRIKAENAIPFPMGSTSSFKVYIEYPASRIRDSYHILLNSKLSRDYYILRRMVYKTIGIVHGLNECHSDCFHIMSRRTVLEPDIKNYDEDEENWENELDLYYAEIYKRRPRR